MMSLLFLLAFVLHNMEEAIWMPEWFKKIKHPQHFGLRKKRFRVALVLITLFAYGLTYFYFADNGDSGTIRYLYLGFVFIAGMNAFFPHLLGTIYYKKYVPGTVTSCVFTLPLSLYIVFIENNISLTDIKFHMGYLASLVILLSTLMLVKKMYRITRKTVRKCLKMVFPADE